MRNVILISLLVVLYIQVLFMQSLQASQDNSYHGNFQTTNPFTQTPVFLALQSQGNTVKGRYTEEGSEESTYQVEGTVIDGVLKGVMINEQMPFMKLKFTAYFSNGQLLFQMDNAIWASIIPAMRFTRRPDPKSASSVQSHGSSVPVSQNKLFGTWVYVERYSSGEFYSSSREYMVISPENLKMYEPVTVVNDGSSSVSSGSMGKLVGTFGYAVEGNKIFIIHPQTGQKVFMCTFTLQDGKMLTQVDGETKRQLWEKVNQ